MYFQVLFGLWIHFGLKKLVSRLSFKKLIFRRRKTGYKCLDPLVFKSWFLVFPLTMTIIPFVCLENVGLVLINLLPSTLTSYNWRLVDAAYGSHALPAGSRVILTDGLRISRQDGSHQREEGTRLMAGKEWHLLIICSFFRSRFFWQADITTRKNTGRSSGILSVSLRTKGGLG